MITEMRRDIIPKYDLNQKPFLNIKEASHATGLSQYFLREGCKNGTVPHIKSGRKYMININQLLELGIPS